MDALVVLKIIITMCLLGGSLYIILSNRYDKDTKKWAMATIGALMLFWLK